MFYRQRPEKMARWPPFVTSSRSNSLSDHSQTDLHHQHPNEQLGLAATNNLTAGKFDVCISGYKNPVSQYQMMSLSSPQLASTAEEEAYLHLQHALRRGQYKPGDRLIPE